MIKHYTLPNKVRIVYERLPQVRSISTGLWIGAGSRYEDISNNGITHLIEHMLFKGTKKRSAKEIAEAIDNIGGHLNAFTDKEYTCYYTKTLDTHLDLSLDLLSDMLFKSRFTKKNIELEKKVVLEEIGMSEDQPDDVSLELLISTAWVNDTMGWPILGRTDSLKSITQTDIREYMKKNYRPDNTVISIVGKFDVKEMITLVTKYFGDWAQSEDVIPLLPTANYNKGFGLKIKDTEQTHVCIGFSGLEIQSDDLMTLSVINNVLGGGMSSRLFQKIREEHGLVYSIHSAPISFIDTGIFMIYAGMTSDLLMKVLELIKDEVDKLVAEGITDDEIAKSKEQFKGSFILSLESTSSRMAGIGKSEIQLNKVHTIDEIIRLIDDVTPEKVTAMIRRIFDFKMLTFSAVGKISDAQRDSVKTLFDIID